MLSTKDLVFKKWLVKKLVDQYVGPYIIDGFYQCNQIMTANFNKNSPGCEYQLSSVIQRTNEKTEGRRSETSKSRWSQRVES